MNSGASVRSARTNAAAKNAELSGMLESCVELTRGEVLAAGEHLAVILEEGERQVAELARLAEQFETTTGSAPAGEERFGDVVAALRGALEDVTTLVGDITSSSVHIRDQSDEIDVRAQELAPLAATMRDVSKRARLLSFNARVESARDRADGETLVALAEEMKALAARSTESAAVMDNLVATLCERLPEMVKSVRVVTKSCSQSQRQLRDGNSDLERSYTRASGAITSAVGSAQTRTDRVQGHCYDVLKRLQFQDRVEQTLQLAGEHVTQVSAFVDDVLRAVEGAEDGPLKAAIVEAISKLDQTYVEDRCEPALDQPEAHGDDEVAVGDMMFL
ncbi:MAG: methyl-accepting chemotaxis protein [Deltaproteobacteria bacterium]|jgi:methyl-accepting chemotaxis protein